MCAAWHVYEERKVLGEGYFGFGEIYNASATNERDRVQTRGFVFLLLKLSRVTDFRADLST